MTTVLDPKRSNAINIGLTTLPPVHVIKAALLNFDEFAVSKDGIEVGIPAKGVTGRCEVWPSPTVSGHFLSLPMVGMGLAFLQSSSPGPGDTPNDLGMSQDQHLRPQASTEGTSCGVVVASSETADYDAHGRGAAED